MYFSIWNFVKNVLSFVSHALCILYTSIYLDSHKQEYLLTAKMRNLVEKLQNILASIENYELFIIFTEMMLLIKYTVWAKENFFLYLYTDNSFLKNFNKKLINLHYLAWVRSIE